MVDFVHVMCSTPRFTLDFCLVRRDILVHFFIDVMCDVQCYHSRASSMADFSFLLLVWRSHLVWFMVNFFVHRPDVRISCD